MACFRPIKIRHDSNDKNGIDLVELKVKCGRCYGCRTEQQRDWAVRCMHEVLTAPEQRASFVTLTYDDAHLPTDNGLQVDHWQNFAKKIRRDVGPFRFLHCGEYGSKNLRPHYHALIFGLDFHESSVELAGTEGLRASSVISKAWKHGIHSIGDVTWQSAKYVASYTVKKLEKYHQQNDQPWHRTIVDEYTGECHDYEVQPEYATMSRRPGLGNEFIKRYLTDVYPDDHVIVGGKPMRPPAYYDKYCEKHHPELWERVRNKRHEAIKDDAWNYTPARMKVRESASKAKRSSFATKTLD